MPSTYTKIASTYLSSGATSVSFSSIPSTYTDLVLRMSSSLTVNGTHMYLNFNNDSSSIYSVTRFVSNNTQNSNTTDATELSLLGFTGDARYMNNAYEPARINAEVYITNYTSNTSKAIQGKAAIANFFASTTASAAGHMSGLYRNTSAITSIQITNAFSSNFQIYSRFDLYGIKNS
jgi:hypothetical protein